MAFKSNLDAMKFHAHDPDGFCARAERQARLLGRLVRLGRLSTKDSAKHAAQLQRLALRVRRMAKQERVSKAERDALTTEFGQVISAIASIIDAREAK